MKGFGNARGVRNLFERTVAAQANRLAALPDVTREMLMTLTADDLRAAEGGSWRRTISGTRSGKWKKKPFRTA